MFTQINYNNKIIAYQGFNTLNQNYINPIGTINSFKIYNYMKNFNNNMNKSNIININNNSFVNPKVIKSKQENNLENRIKYINESFPIFTKNQTNKILNQLDKGVCKICKPNDDNGTGFFCKISFANSFLPVLITVNHVLNEDDIKVNRIITIILIDEKKGKEKEKKIVINEPRITFTNKKLDVTIIEIIPKVDGVKYFLEIDEKFDEFNLKEKIYILQYPKGDSFVSFGKLRERFKESERADIIYSCKTSEGSSGAPILNFNTGKIIGVHKAREGDEGSSKIGTLINYIVAEFKKTYNINKSKLNLNKGEKEKGTEIKFLSNDDYYVGHFKNGKIAIYYNDGKLKYEGDRVDGEFEGKGTYYYIEDGNRYEGEWKKGVKHGKGILYYDFEATKKRYEGNFSKGKFEGKGIYYWDDGSYYKGYFKNGSKHGLGEYYEKDGKLKYKGMFYNNKFEGKGVFYSDNGNFYIGEFMNGLKHGKGILYNKQGGVILKGKFEYNKYLCK